MEQILDKLAWTGFSEDVAIKKAAVLLTEYSSLGCGAGLKELKRVASLTNPKRGQIKARRAAIILEWERQGAVRRKRDETFPYRWGSCKSKPGRLRTFGDANNVEASGIRRYGKLLLIFLGSPYGSDYKGIAIKFPDGRVDVIDFPKPGFGSYYWKTVESMLIEIPRLIVGDERLARAALEGGSVTHSVFDLRSTVSFPDGEEIVVKWPIERVRYAPNRPGGDA